MGRTSQAEVRGRVCWKGKRLEKAERESAPDIQEGHVHISSKNKASQEVHVGGSRDDPGCLGASPPPLLSPPTPAPSSPYMPTKMNTHQSHCVLYLELPFPTCSEWLTFTAQVASMWPPPEVWGPSLELQSPSEHGTACSLTSPSPSLCAP